MLPTISLLLGLALQAPSFERVEAPWPAPLPRQVAERDGARLELRDGRCHRVPAAGSGRALAAVTTEDPGRFLCLSRDPAGITYAATTRGLWAIADDVDAFDPLDLRDGVPGGEPLGCWLDRRRRLWVATETAFGVIETRQFWGRTFTEADGLPRPPFTDFTVDAEGWPWLRNAEGAWRYRPDRGARPRLVHPPHVLEVDAEGRSVVLDVTAEALGGASLRLRRDGRHLREPLAGDPPRVTGLDPGRRRLWVQAFDRDLNASEPYELVVELPRPARFSNAVLLGGAGCLLALLLLGFAWLYRGVPASRTRVLLSAGLGLWLVLQLVAAATPHGKAWPFVGFDMYTERYDEGSLLYKPYAVGLRADGGRVPLGPWWAGRRTDGYWQWLLPLVWEPDIEGPRFLAEGNALHPAEPPLVGYLVFDGKVRLTRAGPVRVAPNLFRAFAPEGLR